MDLEKDGKDQLEGPQNKYAGSTDGRRTTIADERNLSKTKELDWSYTPRKLTIENSSRREDGRKRTRAKPRIKMLDRIMTEGHTKLSYDELKSAAQDILKWRHHYQDLPTQAEN